ncbi:hypothetical protein [Paludisphaera soli]|uniref:hypothetical protein n=1 Tax=Paludisphaera soli TaxID=2712865 RepID=UPI0013EBEC39|nr:hypothetical protein [Paludisphaera soli]
MDRFVTLERMPEGFAIPEDLAGRLAYDPSTRRLSFRGYMSKADFDRLCGLTGDWAFRRKLEELFQRCVYNERPETPGRGLLAALRRRIAPG